MLKRKLRIVQTGDGFILERRKFLFFWELASFTIKDNKPTVYVTVEEAREDGIRLYTRKIVEKIKE
jgi:hypothetical protein